MSDSKAIWDALYRKGDYAPIAPYTDMMVFLARAFGKDGAGKKVLEVGCGTGQNLAFARWAMGFDVYGIDYSPEAVEQAKQLFVHKGLEYGDLKVGDAGAMPFADGQFDAVVERAVLQQNSLEVAKNVVAEMGRVLKPGGGICCSLAAEGHFLFGQGDYRGSGDFFNPDHDGMRHFFARRDVLDVFAGFDLLRWSLHTRQDVLGNRTVEQYYVVEGRKR